MSRCFSQRRHQGDGGRPTAYHHHPLAAVVQLLRPELRMDDLATKQLDTLEPRGIAMLIVVIATAHMQEMAAYHRVAVAIGALDFHQPAGLGC